MIEEPFTTSAAWVAFYSQAELPVLAGTVAALEQLRADAENISGRVLSAVVLQDPLLTLRVLAYIEAHRGRKQNADITTIGRALMMIGTGPFFRDFERLPLVEERLAHHPEALQGALRVIARARQAAHWAREWAMLRHDLDVEEITVATLLREAAEILMWCFAPRLALRVLELQRERPTRRSAECQAEVYGVGLKDLKRDLVAAWGLPELLVSLMDPANAHQPRVLNVELATDLARHSANGWDNAALPDDFRAIESLLHVSHATLLQKLGLEPKSGESLGQDNCGPRLGNGGAQPFARRNSAD